jgi:glutamine amidotransferase
VPVLREAVADKPLLGVCVGLQALFEHSRGGRLRPASALLPGRVRALRRAGRRSTLTASA